MLDLTNRERPWMAAKPTVRAKELGLSSLAACVLGRPVNKALQTSDWRRRPLSAAQLRYAAIDAHVAQQLFERIWDNVPPSELELIRTAGVSSQPGKGPHRTPPPDSHVH